MHRLLIADGASALTPHLVAELSDQFHIEVSYDGDTTLELLHSFEPDILFLDTMLPGIDSYTVLYTLRASGKNTSVIVFSDLVDRLTVRRLNALNVSDILSKPCTLEQAVSSIRDLSFRLCCPDMDDWCVDNEIDRILLSMHFRMGPTRNRIVFHAVRYRYDHPDSSYMKEVCPAVAKLCGGSVTRVEKAIRDGIGRAFEEGKKSIWQMYFPPGDDGELKCPGGDEFITRIAHCIVQRARIRLPYEPLWEKAK